MKPFRTKKGGVFLLFVINVTAEFTSAVFLGVILLSILLQKDMRDIKTKLFFAAAAATMAGSVIDALSFILEAYPVPTALLWTVNVCALVFCDINTVPFIYYAWHIISEKKMISRRYAHSVVAVCVLDFIYVIFGSVTGLLFTIENGVFTEGPLYVYNGIPQLLVLFIFFVYVLCRKKDIGRKIVFTMGTYFIFPLTAAVFDIIFPGLSVVYPASTLVMVVVYINLQSGEIERARMREKLMFEVSNTDTMTKLNNRRAYEAALSSVPRDCSVGVLFCDLNGLKTANDNFGHAAGDELILRFSGILRKHFPENAVFRISGDEFVVLDTGVSSDIFSARTERFLKSVSENDDLAAVGSEYGSGSEVPALLAAAEQKMYTDKNRYYDTRKLPRRRINV